MKKLRILILILFITANSVLANEHKLLFNESLLEYKGGILISNYGTYDKDESKGYILYYKNGILNSFINQGILNKPTAMAVYKNKLYVCDKNQLKIFNLKNLNEEPSIITFSEEDSVLNDIFQYRGILYITSTQADRIYKINLNNEELIPEIWLNIPSPNGIAIKNSTAYIASTAKDYKTINDKNLVYKVNINNPEILPINEKPLLYDGVAVSMNKIYVSDWSTSSIYEINRRTGTQKAIFYKKNMTPADIGISHNKILIPDMFNHRVIKLNLKDFSQVTIK